MINTAAAWKTECVCYCESPSGCAGMPDEMPLFVRISATDWVEGGWDVEQSVELARQLKSPRGRPHRCFLRRAGTAGPHSGGQGLPSAVCPAIRDEAKIRTGAVGLITEARDANEIVTGGDADLVSSRGSCCGNRTGR